MVHRNFNIDEVRRYLLAPLINNARTPVRIVAGCFKGLRTRARAVTSHGHVAFEEIEHIFRNMPETSLARKGYNEAILR